MKLENNFDCQRPNTYKHFTKDLGTWLMAGHHIAFVPIKLTPRQLSGDQFSRLLITVQIEQQQPGFYTGKLVTGTQQLGSGHRSPGRVPTRRIQI